jgi:uncharacterized protein YaaR (DUF327 family)
MSHIFVAHHCFAMESEKSSQDFVIIDSNLCEKILNNNSPHPIVCEEEANGFFTKLGNFNSHHHEKAIKAMQDGKAFYYTKKQGAIIYSSKEPLTMEKVISFKNWIMILQQSTHS